MRCGICGGMTRWLGEENYKCVICGTYQRTTDEGLILPFTLDFFGTAEKVRQAAEEGIKEMVQTTSGEGGVAIPTDMMTFIRRLTERLSPVYPEYSPEVRQDILKTRAELRDGLVNVFESKDEAQAEKRWNDWFYKTKTRRKIHEIKFIQYIVDALEGLTNPDAKAMRDGYRQMLAQGGISV